MSFNTNPNTNCTCRRRVWECPFWLAVEEVVRARFALRLSDLRLTRDDPETFERHNLALFDAVREVSGKQVIVDSSKRLDRLIPLESNRLDVVPIHLIRKPHGVMYSHVKRGRDWGPYAEKYAKGLVMTKEYLDHRSHIELAYHHLVADPPRTPMKVMHEIGLEYHSDQLDWAGRPRHNFGCNRKVRYFSDSMIRLDSSWRQGLSLRQKMLISIATLGARLPGRFFYDRLQPLSRIALSSR